MRPTAQRAFTMVEVLTVIAIIAVLAGILMPVFSRAKAQARQTTCLSNMHQIGTKVSLYQQDYDAYPPLLLGLPERADGSFWAAGDTTPPVAAGLMQRGYLMPAYIKSPSVFACPDNLTDDWTATTLASWPASAGWQGTASFGSHGIAGSPPDTPLPYYAADSYDTSSVIGGADADRVVVYARDWTAASALGHDTRQDNPNQLKYRTPPPDETVICWCNNHVTVSEATMVPVLFLSGTAKPVNAKDVTDKTWNVGVR